MTWTRQRVGWIGTGRMGAPMAERLAKAGVDVAVDDGLGS
ncbi:NAD(P)-binding domain-containing protein [Nonomuraea sp. M3C6]|uniref:NAD(P)-binding domain-containing protein n=1 Tax=Nonomuraea marmarensis TaxID=3351344 RepID=A0ABW7ASA5_9ACTN